MGMIKNSVGYDFERLPIAWLDKCAIGYIDGSAVIEYVISTTPDGLTLAGWDIVQISILGRPIGQPFELRRIELDPSDKLHEEILSGITLAIRHHRADEVEKLVNFHYLGKNSSEEYEAIAKAAASIN